VAGLKEVLLKVQISVFLNLFLTTLMLLWNHNNKGNNALRGVEMTDKYIKRIHGFTLVELSIVIIIIGFLIAGISAGTSLIQQSKLTAVINEVTSYKAASNSFYIAYGYVPGDFPNTYAVWGSLPGTTCTDVDVNVDWHGCNGNGNGYTDIWMSEGILAWEQLGLAGFIPGHYTTFEYQTSNAAGATVIGVNVPASRFPNAGYHILGNADVSYLEIGGVITDDRPAANIMTSVDAASIDQKMDDGRPNSGSTLGNTYGYPPGSSWGGGWSDYCTDGGSNYLLSTPGLVCRLSWTNFLY
jgi:prepilin-type N-terminal cleavage/methylation domain-containing protein